MPLFEWQALATLTASLLPSSLNGTHDGIANQWCQNHLRNAAYLFKGKIIYLNKIRVEELYIALRAQLAWKTSWKHIGVIIL